VKKWLKSAYIYGSYRKIKTGITYFGPLCIYVCIKGTSVSYQVHVLSVSDVVLSSSSHTSNPVAVRLPAVSHVSHYHYSFHST